MLFPDILYTPNSKALTAGLVPRRFAQSQSTNGALTQLGHTYFPVTSKDDLFLLTNVGYLMTPGAAQFARRCDVTIADAAGNGNAYIVNSADPNVAAAAQWGGVVPINDCLVVFGGEQIAIVATFNAGAASNVLLTGIHGIVIPRANWQF